MPEVTVSFLREKLPPHHAFPATRAGALRRVRPQPPGSPGTRRWHNPTVRPARPVALHAVVAVHHAWRRRPGRLSCLGFAAVTTSAHAASAAVVTPGVLLLTGLAVALGAAAALAGVALAAWLRGRRNLPRQHALLAATVDWIWRCDTSGRITDLSALRLGASAPDLSALHGRPLWQLLDADAECPAELAQALSARRPFAPLILRAGERALMLAATPALDGHGLAGTAINVSAVAHGPPAPVGPDQGLAERNRQLELAARELDSFAHSVSHDLRAPLRVVDGFAAILLEDYADARKPLDDLGREHIRRIIAAGSRMNSMIDTLLSMSRMTAAELTRERVSITQLAQELADELRATDRSRRVQFVIGEQLSADGDRTLLRLVLQNLMGNAFKFTGKMNPARIEVGSDTSGPTPVYFVRDNGAGFDMRFADKLFGVFQRFHSANEFPGTGVGLATVQRIIRKHGGRIWAESQPGAGATFFFTLWDSGRTT